MLAPARQSSILRALQRSEAVRVTDLATALGVSEMTVRRDVEALDAKGLLRKIHGGATRIARLSAVEPGFASNADRELEAKAAIARMARTLVEPGMTIALTGGTTTYRLATLLNDVEGLTVVTNSLKAAEALNLHQPAHGTKVIVTGGERTPSEALVGSVASAAIEMLNADICFLGVHGVDLRRGLTSPNLVEAETNRAFARSAARLVVLADHTKFGVRALACIAGLSEVDTLITDDGADDDVTAAFRPLIKSLLIAAPSAASPSRNEVLS
ncbi:DeoR/GlpR transcriptional regulator [Paenarthrobacter sp. Z7-10]|uniref:DeoR/GlpR family DNA-binding transcription regulator n=1 Tax=Paenarthrobacter sp. Z7-10 TaxID=2787635 RepID=UPI0022A8D784|nr:DeoR/GlpR family DNA-binding transcription regulator [Paenarthrobacter sp. Z7-10]MCZ2404418.1 DeoR/GlpR transcriptional regulator [Paenarthrobacter sp. Z7-10]